MSLAACGGKETTKVRSGGLFFNVTEPLEDDETLNIRTSTLLEGKVSAFARPEIEDREDLTTVQQPAGWVGNPLDIANMVLYLCSDKAGFITGENICIDGGMVAERNHADRAVKRNKKEETV